MTEGSVQKVVTSEQTPAWITARKERAFGNDARQIATGRRVIDFILEGRGVRKACEESGCKLHQFYSIISSHKELAVGYARAREIQADVLVDEAIAAVDNPDIDPQRGRNMSDVRRWAASKYNQRVYGDRVDLNVSTAISVTDALAEASKRAALPFGVPGFTEAEIVDKDDDIFS